MQNSSTTLFAWFIARILIALSIPVSKKALATIRDVEIEWVSIPSYGIIPMVTVYMLEATVNMTDGTTVKTPCLRLDVTQ